MSIRMCVLVLGSVAGAAAQSYDWKGFYIGGNAGGAVGKSTPQTLPTFSLTGYFAQSSTVSIYNTSRQQTMSPQGFTGGGQVGYNFQHRMWVLGFEGDF